MIDAMPGDIHHAVGQGGTDKYAYAGNEQHGLERGSFCTDRRLEEVDSVIADPYDEIEHRKDKQEDDNT